MHPDQPAGPAFPFRIDPDSGRVAVSAGPDKLRQNLVHLLLTRTGERLMARGYGAGPGVPQEMADDGLRAVLRHQIARAVVQFEPRVLPRDVTLVIRDGELYVRLDYLVAGDPQVRSALIPVR